MREIKFHYIWKHTKFGGFVHEHYSLNQLEEAPSSLTQMGGNYAYALVARRQFTGVKDKNGSKIFEGDLISNDHGKICKVFFDLRDASFDCEAVCDILNTGESHSLWEGFQILKWVSHVTVIGNIYQNPERM